MSDEMDVLLVVGFLYFIFTIGFVLADNFISKIKKDK